MVELDNPFAKAHKASEIIDALPLKRGVRALDIGCGPGRVLLPLAQKVAEVKGQVTGLDIQVEMLNKTLVKAKKLNITNIDVIHGNIDEVPLGQNYDIILMICVLGEIPKDARELVIVKIANHLQPEGIISITEIMFDPHFQKHQAVTGIMEKVGFVETKFIGNWLAYTAQFQKKFSLKNLDERNNVTAILSA